MEAGVRQQLRKLIRTGATDRGRAALQPLLVALWCALAAGLLEGLRHLAWRHVLHRLVWMSADVYWMAPLSYLAYFAVPALALSLLALLRPRWVPLWLPVFLFAFAGSFGVLFLIGRQRISLWALGVVAMGIGVRAARAGHERPAAVLRAVHTSVPWLGSATLAIMAWSLIARPLRERLEVASLPTVSPSAVNVLLIILDTVRAQDLGLYGYDRPTTPNLERLASTGVVFEDAIAPAPWTLPSHASLFTGRWPHELSAGFQTPLDGSAETVAESFRARGYVTAAFVANHLYASRETGLNRGFIHYSDHRRSLRQLLLSSHLGQSYENWRTSWWTGRPVSDRKVASEVSRNFLRWLNRDHQRPFFAFLNYFAAHQPYYAPREYRSRYHSANARLDAYDAAIAYIDHELGGVFDELDRRGLLDHTIVVITSDHGEQFGEHGLFEHANSLYEPLLHVPLVIRYPVSVPGGLRIGGYVSLRDLPATLAELAASEAEFSGKSLASLWTRNGLSSQDTVLAEVEAGIRLDPSYPLSKGAMKAVFGGRYHFIRNGDGKPEVYDLQQDHGELKNLAGTTAGDRATRQLSEWLHRQLDQAGR